MLAFMIFDDAAKIILLSFYDNFFVIFLYFLSMKDTTIAPAAHKPSGFGFLGW